MSAPCQRPCPLSLAFARQLSQRESHWQAGPLSADRWKFNMAQKIVPCYRDSQQLDKGYCPEAAALCSRALLFPIKSNFARPAWASPARQWLPLWESWHRAAMTERARTLGAATRAVSAAGGGRRRCSQRESLYEWMVGKMIFTAKKPFWLSVVRVPLYFWTMRFVTLTA